MHVRAKKEENTVDDAKKKKRES